MKKIISKGTQIFNVPNNAEGMDFLKLAKKFKQKGVYLNKKGRGSRKEHGCQEFIELEYSEWIAVYLGIEGSGNVLNDLAWHKIYFKKKNEQCDKNQSTIIEKNGEIIELKNQNKQLQITLNRWKDKAINLEEIHDSMVEEIGNCRKQIEIQRNVIEQYEKDNFNDGKECEEYIKEIESLKNTIKQMNLYNGNGEKDNKETIIELNKLVDKNDGLIIRNEKLEKALEFSQANEAALQKELKPNNGIDKIYLLKKIIEIIRLM